MEQTTTTINGYKVSIFKGYYGTQLFITDKQGVQIYAHKVSGDAMARARQIILGETPESMEQPASPKMICLHEQSRSELRAALKRGFENEFVVFADWDRDSFVIVNKTKNTEYRVRLDTQAGSTFAMCSCPDFQTFQACFSDILKVKSKGLGDKKRLSQ